MGVIFSGYTYLSRNKINQLGMPALLKILAALMISALAGFLGLIVYVWDNGYSFGIFGPPLPIPFWRRLPDPEGHYLQSRRQKLESKLRTALDTFSATGVFSVYGTSKAYICEEGLHIKWGDRPFNHRCTLMLVQFYGFDGDGDLLRKLKECDPKLAAQGWTRGHGRVSHDGGKTIKDEVMPLSEAVKHNIIAYTNTDRVIQLTWKDNWNPFFGHPSVSVRVLPGRMIYRSEELEGAHATINKILKEHSGVLALRISDDFYEN